MHQSWDDYFCRGYGADPDIYRERLEMLRIEQEKSMFNPRQTEFNFHPLDFKCQCKRCVKLHTITMKDAELLRSMKITWNQPLQLSHQA